jgi:hypothetical protein
MNGRKEKNEKGPGIGIGGVRVACAIAKMMLFGFKCNCTVLGQKRNYSALCILRTPQVLCCPVGDPQLPAVGYRELGVAAGAINNGPVTLLRVYLYFLQDKRRVLLLVLTTVPPILGARAEFGFLLYCKKNSKNTLVMTG